MSIFAAMNPHISYTIKLPQFEGPFDLLLFFIERDELDIYDIPISKITDDFLAYIRDMERMNIDLASEFIVVAATLCRIKAHMLIPRRPVDEDGNEIDPREELIRRLIEYKRYKSVLEEMRKLEEARSLKDERGNVTKELKEIASKALVDVELEKLTLFKLLRAFENVMQRFEDRNPRTIHEIIQFSYTVENQREIIIKNVKVGEKTSFKTVFAHCQNRIHAIVTFLTLLEMLNLELIEMVSGEGTNNFWITAVDPNREERPDVIHEDEVEKEDEDESDDQDQETESENQEDIQ